MPIKLEPKAFKVLAYLTQDRDRVVTQDELFEKLWSGEFVTEGERKMDVPCIAKRRTYWESNGQVT